MNKMQENWKMWKNPNLHKRCGKCCNFCLSMLAIYLMPGAKALFAKLWMARGTTSPASLCVLIVKLRLETTSPVDRSLNKTLRNLMFLDVAVMATHDVLYSSTAS